MINVNKHSQFRKKFSKKQAVISRKAQKSPWSFQESGHFDNIYTFRYSMCDTAALSNENALLHLSKNYYAR